MRRLVDRARVERFMRALGREAAEEVRLYFTGGVTAVLSGWRESTIDLDLRFTPESDSVYRALPRLKEELEVNIELASPADFLPRLPGWEGRSQYIDREGKISYFHYDLYSQALSKIERGHTQDQSDVEEMLLRGLIEPDELMRLFEEIEPELYRFPAVDPVSFREAVEEVVERFSGG